MNRNDGEKRVNKRGHSSIKHRFIARNKLGFSMAAETRSLSFSCLLIASSVSCDPSVMRTSSLNRAGRLRISLTMIDSPINVAALQCVIVGVKRTRIELFSSSTSTFASSSTCNCSSVYGCSGSRMPRIMSYTSRASKASSNESSSKAFDSNWRADTRSNTVGFALSIFVIWSWADEINRPKKNESLSTCNFRYFIDFKCVLVVSNLTKLFMFIFSLQTRSDIYRDSWTEKQESSFFRLLKKKIYLKKRKQR